MYSVLGNHKTMTHRYTVNVIHVYRGTIVFTQHIQYTFEGFNQCSSIIDHFILSENMEMLIKEYYATDSIDNLSDHIPLYGFTVILQNLRMIIMMHSKKSLSGT